MKKIILSLAVVASLMSCQQQKTAYVDNTVLIQDYYKMESTEAKYEEKSKKMSDELDANVMEFQKEVQEFQKNEGSMSKAELEREQNRLMQKQQMLQQQQQQQSQALRQESDQAIDSLIKEVRDFVEDYGKENGYTYIFGSNESANIMYAKEGLDITDDILEELNKGHESDSEEKESTNSEE
ncbi:OmpH family outer membrane protein [Psychroflexus aestuariivivens]|uniref:OmpH family outer membrane protein n=1 Tax=Psychroflexus aestuariivivens TaxID=1795040 RepID=UPI000FD9C169|nr:OmpH family outer membrane protein [Psychroflexus aestuariivivens]